MLDNPLINEEQQLCLKCDRCGLKYGNQDDEDDYKHIDILGMCVSCDEELEI